MEDEKIYITKGDAVLALLEKGQHSKRYKLGETWELKMFDICGEFNVGTGVVTHWMSLPESPKDGEIDG